jgi:hypothetical protein
VIGKNKSEQSVSIPGEIPKLGREAMIPYLGRLLDITINNVTTLGVYSASNRNEYQKHINNNVSGSKVWRVRKADNLTAIYELIV